MRIFLAFSFRDEDKELVSHVERVLSHQDVSIVTGERLGGEQLTPAVQARIDQSEALIGLLTRRDQMPAGGWTTHQWVRDELGYARARQKRAIALVEQGVDTGGMYQPHEYVPLDRANPLPALLALSETVWAWKRETGRTIKVQILPQSLAEKLGDERVGVRCRQRLWLQGRYTDWKDVIPVPEGGGGTFVYIEGVQEDHLVQLQVQDQNTTWQSHATSQWMAVDLKRGGGIQ